jgi:hypothetical protein
MLNATLNPSQWGMTQWVDAANGFLSGYGNIGYYFKVIKNDQKQSTYDNSYRGYNVGKRLRGWHFSSLAHSTWKIATTSLNTYRIATALKSNPLFSAKIPANYKKIITTVAVVWGLLNLQTFLFDRHQNRPQEKSNFDHFCCEIWSATPKLLLATNIALTALETAYINPHKGWTSFCTMAISVYDKTRELGLSPGLSWAFNKPLYVGMAGLAFYGGDKRVRTWMVVSKVFQLIVQKT